jgi:FSR family fosmidomycin resistance protein-like MFS transporter
MTIFFVVSCAVQTASGFLVDRFGPRPSCSAGWRCWWLAAFGFAASPNYWMMAFFSRSSAGIGNGVFHPVDYTLLNRKVSAAAPGPCLQRARHHRQPGLGAAPALVVPLAIAFAGAWRWRLGRLRRLGGAGVLWFNRERWTLPPHAAPGQGRMAPRRKATSTSCASRRCGCASVSSSSTPVVLSVVQAFAPEAARHLHDVPVALAAACLTVYMVCSAGGMVLGGFLASDPARCERIVGAGFGLAALALALAIGFAPVPRLRCRCCSAPWASPAASAGPSRDMLVKRPRPRTTGRVYGVVYSGLDIGQAIAPLVFGA